MTGKDCAGASPAPLICSADPRQSRRDFPPKPSYPPAEQKSPPILTRRYCRDAFHSETKDSRGRRDGRGKSLPSIFSHVHMYKFFFFFTCCHLTGTEENKNVKFSWKMRDTARVVAPKREQVTHFGSGETQHKLSLLIIGRLVS